MAPRLLYLPNEPVEGWQSGPRNAFRRMLAAGAVADCRIVSFELEAARQGAAATRRVILETCRDFGPDIVLWQHVGNFEIDDSLLHTIRNGSTSPLLVYHEADVFGRWIKRPTRPMGILARAADLTFTVGGGWWADRMRSLGARDVRYLPHYYDADMFGGDWTPPTERRFDVVMIGNLVESRLRFTGYGLPGTRERRELASSLHERYGERFALFGRGWDRFPFARGPVPFAEQEKVIRDAWLSVIWDHFPDIPDYFSDRLPISLAAGVAHATNAHPGYDRTFENGGNLIFEPTLPRLLARIDAALAAPRDRLAAIGLAGQALARDRYTADRVLGEMIRQCVAERSRRGG